MRLQFDTQDIDFSTIREILKETGMGYHEAQKHKEAFNNSNVVVFIFDEDKLVGFGRAISDKSYQSAIYDVAVIPSYQGKGIGKLIIKSIIEKNPKHTHILYSAIGKEEFYIKNGFSKMKTGMALFEKDQEMRERGFIE